MIRVLVVASQSAIRFGLKMRLKLEPDITVVGEPVDSLAALAQTAVLRPDVILLDIGSSDMDSSRLMKAMQSASPTSAIVVLSLHDDAAARRRAAHAGAAAFVAKHERGEPLLLVIRKAGSGTAASNHALPAGRQAPGLSTGREGA